MYGLQPRLEQPRGKRALRLLEQPRFRSAFDLLMLRLQLAVLRSEPRAFVALKRQVQELASALDTRVDVGPLPYGLRLTGITLLANAARVTAHAGTGSEKL